MKDSVEASLYTVALTTMCQSLQSSPLSFNLAQIYEQWERCLLTDDTPKQQLVSLVTERLVPCITNDIVRRDSDGHKLDIYTSLYVTMQNCKALRTAETKLAVLSFTYLLGLYSAVCWSDYKRAHKCMSSEIERLRDAWGSDSVLCFQFGLLYIICSFATNNEQGATAVALDRMYSCGRKGLASRYSQAACDTMLLVVMHCHIELLRRLKAKDTPLISSKDIKYMRTRAFDSPALKSVQATVTSVSARYIRKFSPIRVKSQGRGAATRRKHEQLTNKTVYCVDRSIVLTPATWLEKSAEKTVRPKQKDNFFLRADKGCRTAANGREHADTTARAGRCQFDERIRKIFGDSKMLNMRYMLSRRPASQTANPKLSTSGVQSRSRDRSSMRVAFNAEEQKPEVKRSPTFAKQFTISSRKKSSYSFNKKLINYNRAPSTSIMAFTRKTDESRDLGVVGKSKKNSYGKNLRAYKPSTFVAKSRDLYSRQNSLTAEYSLAEPLKSLPEVFIEEANEEEAQAVDNTEARRNIAFYGSLLSENTKTAFFKQLRLCLIELSAYFNEKHEEQQNPVAEPVTTTETMCLFIDPRYPVTITTTTVDDAKCVHLAFKGMRHKAKELDLTAHCLVYSHFSLEVADKEDLVDVRRVYSALRYQRILRKEKARPSYRMKRGYSDYINKEFVDLYDPNCHAKQQTQHWDAQKGRFYALNRLLFVDIRKPSSYFVLETYIIDCSSLYTREDNYGEEMVGQTRGALAQLKVRITTNKGDDASIALNEFIARYSIPLELIAGIICHPDRSNRKTAIELLNRAATQPINKSMHDEAASGVLATRPTVGIPRAETYYIETDTTPLFAKPNPYAFVNPAFVYKVPKLGIFRTNPRKSMLLLKGAGSQPYSADPVAGEFGVKRELVAGRVPLSFRYQYRQLKITMRTAIEGGIYLVGADLYYNTQSNARPGDYYLKLSFKKYDRRFKAETVMLNYASVRRYYNYTFDITEKFKELDHRREPGRIGLLAAEEPLEDFRSEVAAKLRSYLDKLRNKGVLSETMSARAIGKLYDELFGAAAMEAISTKVIRDKILECIGPYLVNMQTEPVEAPQVQTRTQSNATNNGTNLEMNEEVQVSSSKEHESIKEQVTGEDQPISTEPEKKSRPNIFQRILSKKSKIKEPNVVESLNSDLSQPKKHTGLRTSVFVLSGIAQPPGNSKFARPEERRSSEHITNQYARPGLQSSIEQQKDAKPSEGSQLQPNQGEPYKLRRSQYATRFQKVSEEYFNAFDPEYSSDSGKDDSLKDIGDDSKAIEEVKEQGEERKAGIQATISDKGVSRRPVREEDSLVANRMINSSERGDVRKAKSGKLNSRRFSRSRIHSISINVNDIPQHLKLSLQLYNPETEKAVSRLVDRVKRLMDRVTYWRAMRYKFYNGFSTREHNADTNKAQLYLLTLTRLLINNIRTLRFRLYTRKVFTQYDVNRYLYLVHDNSKKTKDHVKPFYHCVEFIGNYIARVRSVYLVVTLSRHRYLSEFYVELYNPVHRTRFLTVLKSLNIEESMLVATGNKLNELRDEELLRCLKRTIAISEQGQVEFSEYKYNPKHVMQWSTAFDLDYPYFYQIELFLDDKSVLEPIVQDLSTMTFTLRLKYFNNSYKIINDKIRLPLFEKVANARVKLTAAERLVYLKRLSKRLLVKIDAYVRGQKGFCWGGRYKIFDHDFYRSFGSGPAHSTQGDEPHDTQIMSTYPYIFQNKTEREGHFALLCTKCVTRDKIVSVFFNEHYRLFKIRVYLNTAKKCHQFFASLAYIEGFMPSAPCFIKLGLYDVLAERILRVFGNNVTLEPLFDKRVTVCLNR